MMKQQPKPPKSYKDIEFLGSPEARTLRILSEFLAPHRRFRLEHVRDTIVFFGSARILSKKQALKEYRELKKQSDGNGRKGAGLSRALQEAATKVDMSRYYEDTVLLARRMTDWSRSLAEPGRFMICSGGGPGIMEAANKGAYLGGGRSVGLNISLPFEQFANPYVTPDLSLEFHYFFMRKFWFAYLAKALVVMPGGFGTLDELMEMLTLIQTQKISKKIAVIIYGSEYWKNVLDFDYLISRGVVSKKDLSLFRTYDDVDSAEAYLKEFLTRYYVKGTK
jgi:uncharacterized protein (TIGR00730 family)